MEIILSPTRLKLVGVECWHVWRTIYKWKRYLINSYVSVHFRIFWITSTRCITSSIRLLSNRRWKGLPSNVKIKVMGMWPNGWSFFNHKFLQFPSASLFLKSTRSLPNRKRIGTKNGQISFRHRSLGSFDRRKIAYPYPLDQCAREATREKEKWIGGACNL